jgi:predicted nuclease with TOPRIM domain
MPEEKKRSGVKVCGWLSDKVFSKLIEKGYKSHTVIVRRGAELIIGQPIGEHGELEQGTTWGTEENANEYTEHTREHIENIGELRELRAQVREQREHIETLKIHNETLKAELEKSNHDKDDLKETHKNYMIQMQTLINQKSIEAPGTKKSWWRFW